MKRSAFGLAVWLLALGLLPAPALSEAPVQHGPTAACPLLKTTTGQPDPGHWFSPPAANTNDKAPNPCNPCSDPANAPLKTCGVYRFLTSPACASGTCADREGEFRFYQGDGRRFFLQRDTRYQHPDRFPLAEGENCRFVLWAAEPVVGLEDVNAHAGRNHWSDAYFASESLVMPAFPRDDLAFLTQSALNRSQHQLHIHVGTLAATYGTALARLAPAPGEVARTTINGYAFRVRMIPVVAGSDPFAGVDIFAIARDMLPAGAADLPTHGILAAITHGGTRLWVLVAERLDRIELNYRQAVPCRLR